MSEEDQFIAYMLHPDTNKQVVASLLDDCMAEIQYAATMTVISVIWSDRDAS